MRTVLLALLAILVIAPGARAWQAAPVTDEARQALYLPLARAAWPDSPCNGQEEIHLHADAVLQHQADLFGYGDVRGYNEPGTCRVFIRSGLSAHQFCVDLVHELGHAAGREHTSVPGDVMNGDGNADYQPCAALTDPPPIEQARGYVREQLPAGAWRVVCTSMRDRHPRCRAERGRRTMRFKVHVEAGEVVSAVPS